MKLLFRRQIFSTFINADVYDEDNRLVYTVKGGAMLTRYFKIYDADHFEVGMLQERPLPCLYQHFDLIVDHVDSGCIVRKRTFIKPRYTLNIYNWLIQGDWPGWNYEIKSPAGMIATIAKRPFHVPNTYDIDLSDPAFALETVMVAVAIDAGKYSLLSTRN